MRYPIILTGGRTVRSSHTIFLLTYELNVRIAALLLILILNKTKFNFQYKHFVKNGAHECDVINNYFYGKYFERENSIIESHRRCKWIYLLIVIWRNMCTIISMHDIFVFVHFSMLAQSRVGHIALSTDIAWKGSFTSVQADMSDQRWITFEGFVAILANKRSLIDWFLV